MRRVRADVVGSRVDEADADENQQPISDNYRHQDRAPARHRTHQNQLLMPNMPKVKRTPLVPSPARRAREARARSQRRGQSALEDRLTFWLRPSDLASHHRRTNVSASVPGIYYGRSLLVGEIND